MLFFNFVKNSSSANLIKIVSYGVLYEKGSSWGKGEKYIVQPHRGGELDRKNDAPSPA